MCVTVTISSFYNSYRQPLGSFVSCNCNKECVSRKCECVKSNLFCNTLEYESLLESSEEAVQDVKSCVCVDCDNLYTDWSSNVYVKQSTIIDGKGLFACSAIHKLVFNCCVHGVATFNFGALFIQESSRV